MMNDNELLYRGSNMQKLVIKKLAAAAMLTALAVILSAFSIPIGVSRCFPVQHMVNVVAAVLFGPVYSVMIAFCTSLIRNLLGTGSLLAFPGSMVGALLCGLIYQKFHKLLPAYLGEVIGTGVLGALLCYPVAALLMGKETALFAYVIPFMISTVGGTILAAAVIGALYKTRAMNYMQQLMEKRAQR